MAAGGLSSRRFAGSLREPTPTASRDRLFARQLGQHCRLRFGVVAMIVLGCAIGPLVVGIEGLPVPLVLAVAAMVLSYGSGVAVALRALMRVAAAQDVARRLHALGHATILADYVALTALIHGVGGARSPFLAVFLLHIVLGSAMVRPRVAWLYTSFALVLLNGTVLGDLAGLTHPYLPSGAVASTEALDPRFAAGISVAYSFLFLGATALMTRVAEALRNLEEELADANGELEKLSRARRDFLHVALHNLKAPLAATTMMLNNVALGLAGPLASAQRALVDRALARLAESELFIRDLALLASLDARELRGLDRAVDVSAMLQGLVDEHRELAEAREQQLLVEPSSSPLLARGHQRLLHEALVNLVTNAIKYTPRGGTIRLGATADTERVRIRVLDDGPGVPIDDRPLLFREFSRLGTVLPDGERPPGTGLGLSLVRRIVEAHGGSVGVGGGPPGGAEFFVLLPRAGARERPRGDLPRSGTEG